MIKTKNNLEMRVVPIAYLKEFNELLRYVFQVTNSELEAIGWKPKEIEQEKRPVLEQAHVLGWFDQGRLVSQVATYPMEVNIHGRLFKMGGVTGVGTYPEYASHGLAKDLIFQALLDMKKQGQTISYLYPYSIPYYRKKGWEIFSDHLKFTVPDLNLPKPKDVPGMVRRVDVEHIDVRHVYNAFAKNHHGSLVRHDLEWQEYWRWDDDDLIAAIYYNQDNSPSGYLLYHILSDEFIVKEMIYLNQEARIGLWNYISAHQSMVDRVIGNNFIPETIAFQLDDAEITETITPYFMARIVDVQSFLEQFPFHPTKETITFNISDPLLDFNSHAFTVQTALNQNIVTKDHGSNHVVTCTIQTLVTMLMSYRRPRYLHKIERLEASHETVTLLESMIPNNEPYFSDYF